MQLSKRTKKYIMGTDGKGPIIIGKISGRSGIPHIHERVHEYFIVARGSMTIKVGKRVLDLKEDDALMVEPGETHRIVRSSDDLKCYIIKHPGDNCDKKVCLLGLRFKPPF